MAPQGLFLEDSVYLYSNVISVEIFNKHEVDSDQNIAHFFS